MTPAGRRDERGAIAVIAAIAMTMILAATALSFDIGREVDTNRAVQALADAVALDAANFVDGTAATASDPYDTIGGNAYELAQVVQYEATQSALRNNVSTTDLPSDYVTIGSCPTTSSCTTNFTAVMTCPLTTTLPMPATSAGTGAGEACTPVAGADQTTAINAVRATASSVTSFVFQAGNATSSRDATAVRSFAGGPQRIPVSAFSIGSTLLDLSNPVVDDLLSLVLGPSAANISVLSYNGLAGVSVSLGDILAANVGVGSMYNLLNTAVSPSTLLGYTYNALIAQNTAGALTAAGQLNTALGVTGAGSTAITDTTAIKPCQLIDLTGGQSACGVTGSALTTAAFAQLTPASVLTAIVGLSVANQSSGIGLNVSGLGLLNIKLSAVSPMASAGPGPANDPCPTGMTPCPVTATDTQMTATLTVANIDLGVATVGLTIQATAADATGTLTGVGCGTSPAGETATISGTTDAAALSTLFDIKLLGVPIDDTTTVDVGGATFANTFNGPFGPGEPAPWSSTNTSPAITIPPPSGLVSTVLSPLTDLLDTVLDPILSPLLSALGVNLGYATLIDNYVNCNSAVLAG